jgi:hypothetical protein
MFRNVVFSFKKSQGKHNNLDYQFQNKVPLIAKFQL